MALDAKEQAKLQELLSKAKKMSEPLTADDMAKIEENIAMVYSANITRFGGLIATWDEFCRALQLVASDNAKLMAEVVRLRALFGVGQDQKGA